MACAEIALEGARQAGAACVNELADRLSLRKRVAAASARREGGLADRAMAARMGRPKIENVLRFRVSGSKGTPYDMVLRTDGRSDRKLFCSCPGAKFRAECRHMKSLLSGDYRAVMVGSEEEGRQLSTLLSASLRVFDAA